MTGHTPGPWTVAEPGEVDEHYGVLDGFGHTASVYGYPEEASAALANARLISAAPDLLAACQAVAHDLQAALDGDDFSGMPDAELFRAFLNVLLPAIAKAEGTPAWDASMDGPTSE